MNGEPLSCAVCSAAGPDVRPRIVDMRVSGPLTGREREPGERHRSENQCERCFALYARVQAARADLWDAQHPRPGRFPA